MSSSLRQRSSGAVSSAKGCSARWRITRCEGGEGLQFGGVEQFDEVFSDVFDVLGRGAPIACSSGGKQADHDDAADESTSSLRAQASGRCPSRWESRPSFTRSAPGPRSSQPDLTRAWRRGPNAAQPDLSRLADPAIKAAAYAELGITVSYHREGRALLESRPQPSDVADVRVGGGTCQPARRDSAHANGVAGGVVPYRCAVRSTSFWNRRDAVARAVSMGRARSV